MDKHDTILISCQLPEHRRLLRGVLEERYNLLEAGNAVQSMMLLRQNIDCIAAVLVDVPGREILDEEMLNRQENMDIVNRVPVIVITERDAPEVVNAAFGYGASDVIPLHYDPYAMLRRIENIVDLHLHRVNLEAMVEEQANILRHSNETMVDALSSIIEYRSVESGQHILRIRHFTRILLEEVARSCPEYRLKDRDITLISSASALHDIGKIAIPDAVLMKPGRLTAGEWEVMKTHSLTGCHILDSLGDMGDPEYMRYAHNICHYHHERWDGGGYPEGLAGEEIPICAQVVGLADVYDALTSKRVYKDAYSFSKAVNMILRGECGVFSPKLLECFKHVTGAYENLSRAYADGLSPKSESFDVTLPPPVLSRSNDTVERIGAKYFALVHYINAFLMEMDLNQGLFHLVYNPYPDMAPFDKINTLEEMEKVILEQLVVEEERERMKRFIHETMPLFIEKDLRRMTTRFRFRGRNDPAGEPFEVTLLRLNPVDANSRTLAALVRRVSGEAEPVPEGPVQEESTCCCRNDGVFTLVSASPRLEELTGYSEDQLGGSLMELIPAGERERVRCEFTKQLRRGTRVRLEQNLLCRDGSVIRVLNECTMVTGQDGRELLHWKLTDISQTMADYSLLRKQLDRYKTILSRSENVLFEWAVEADNITFSENWKDIFGYPAIRGSIQENLGENSHLHPDDLIPLSNCIARLREGSDYEMTELRIAGDKGRYLWCRFQASPIRDKEGRLLKVVGMISNIDVEKQAEQQLQERAQRDSLTRLLNKNAARKQAEEYLSQNPGAECAMLIIDLDNFKQMNDRYGHLFGDAVLTKASREIGKLFRNQDIVARIGGDEFLVVMRDISDRVLLENRCRRLKWILRSLFQNQKIQEPLSCSIGIALSPEHGSSYFDLFNHADQALYQAKAEGRDCFVFYDPQREQLSAMQALPTAVSNRIDSDQEPGLADDNIVRYAFQRLYTTKDVESSVNEILALIGQKMNVSRVYVFENSDDNRFCSNTYEWCNEDIPPEIDMLQNVSYEKDIPGYEDNFDERGIFYCPDITVLPQRAYDILEAQGIKSMLQCAIREGGVFRGYIGFDECVEQRFWTKEQIQTLTYFSEMLSIFLLKQRKQEQALTQAEELSSILDNQNAWIYIIDPESCRLKYLNAKTKQIAPEVQPGMCCYKALMGNEERCPGCPALDIRSRRNSSAVMYNDQFDLNTLAEATLINWGGEESCLLTCREIPR